MDYTYTGLTAYILPHTGDIEKLNVLATAIDGLNNQVEPIGFDEMKFQNVTGSDVYDFLYNHDALCYPHDSELPKGTPDQYKRPQIDGVTIKDMSLIRLYVPAVAKSADKVEEFIHNALYPAINSLFGNEVLCVKTKTAMEYENFQDGKETVLLSANKQAVLQAA